MSIEIIIAYILISALYIMGILSAGYVFMRFVPCLLFGHEYIKDLETKDHEYIVIEYCSNCGREKHE